MKHTSITGKETKAIIRVALKKVFPNCKFSLTSSHDSVHVSWDDGALEKDVTKVLNRFESFTYVYSVSDFYRPTGFEWLGNHFLGARYLSTNRSLSEDRRNRLTAQAEKEGLVFHNLNKLEQTAVEEKLIQSGDLSGITPLDYPELMLAERPSVDERKQEPAKIDPPDNVVQLFSPIQQVQHYSNAMTKEQKLKCVALIDMMGATGLVEYIDINNGLSIDDVFALAAQEIF